MKYSYEYNEDSVLTIDNRIDWFFRLDVLETICDEEISLKSVKIDIFTLTSLHSEQIHEIDWFRLIFVRSRRHKFELLDV